MTKKKPIVCTITKQKRSASDQPFTVSIAEPGKTEYNLKPRYSRKDAAWRGALRHLKAVNILGETVDQARHRMIRASAYGTPPPNPRDIEFIYVDKSKPARKGEKA